MSPLDCEAPTACGLPPADIGSRFIDTTKLQFRGGCLRHSVDLCDRKLVCLNCFLIENPASREHVRKVPGASICCQEFCWVTLPVYRGNAMAEAVEKIHACNV